jgi:NAD(P)-dependent dehydrogenase (short-subunit alcohol dehydrogenase family)
LREQREKRESAVAGELEGQVAVVTGSGRGFGRTIARHLADAGASVIVTARTREEIVETVGLIEESGGHAVAIPADVRSREDIEHLRSVAESEFGPVTIAIHNAGVPWPFGPIWHVDPDVWWEAQEVHVRASLYMIHTFVPSMVERGGGRVIIIASAAGVRISANINGYGVAKSTQIRIAQFLAREGAANNIVAFACHPGDVLTGISDLTIADPDARRFAAGFVERLTNRKAAHEDGAEGLEACGRLCVRLGSGRYDELSGRYLTPADDLDALVAEHASLDDATLGLTTTRR